MAIEAGDTDVHVVADSRQDEIEAHITVTLTRTQALVLGFFIAALLFLVSLYLADRATFARALRLPPAVQTLAPLVLVVLSAIIVGAAIGTVRRWRWLFWLLLIAFLTGVLRPLVLILEPAPDVLWYGYLQAGIGVVQFAIALLMLRGYRRAGIWGSF
jgi:hypothetical protein